MSQEELLWGFGLPALVCGAVLLAVFRPWSNASPAGGRWAGANALAAGVAAAYLVARNWQVSVPPRQSWEWLVYLAVGLAIAVGYGAPVGGRGKPAWTLRLFAAGLASYLIVGTRVDQFWAWRAVTAAMMVASVLGLERLSDRTGSAVTGLTLALATAAASVVLMKSRNGSLADLTGGLAACFAAAALLGWWRPSVSLGSGGFLVAGILVPGLVMCGYFSGGRVPAWCFLVAAAAPAACWLPELPAVQRHVSRQPVAFRAGAILVAAGVAAVGALIG